MRVELFFYTYRLFNYKGMYVFGPLSSRLFHLKERERLRSVTFFRIAPILETEIRNSCLRNRARTALGRSSKFRIGEIGESGNVTSRRATRGVRLRKRDSHFNRASPSFYVTCPRTKIRARRRISIRGGG